MYMDTIPICFILHKLYFRCMKHASYVYQLGYGYIILVVFYFYSYLHVVVIFAAIQCSAKKRDEFKIVRNMYVRNTSFRVMMGFPF